MTNKQEDLIIEKMAEFGFTKYEAKTYIALLETNKISAYEISKRSGVPQSKIYETVKNLVQEGVIIAQDENPVLYSPLPLKEFIERYRNKMEKNLNILEEGLNKISQGSTIDYMWHFEGRENCLTKIKKIINNAQKRIALEIWEQEYNQLQEELEEASERGVKIIIIFYGEEIDLAGEIYYHRLENLQSYTTKQGRWLTILADRQDCFFSSFAPESTDGIWSQNQAFMLMAESFISHDIYIAEIYDKFGKELDQEFGANLDNLRQKIKRYLN